MSRYRERAMELFNQGYNCSQAVFAAFHEEIGMDFDTALKISSSFGGGMGRLREVCGAISGIFMVAGMQYGYTDPKDIYTKEEHYRLIQSMADKFKETNKSLICRELLGLTEQNKNYIPDSRTDEYYRKSPCVEFVGDAAEIMHEIIKNNNSMKKDKYGD